MAYSRYSRAHNTNGYSWHKVHVDLTEEQVARGVIFSSELKVVNHPEIERVRHEVLRSDPNRGQKMRNLHDVEFFKNMARAFGYKVIEEVRY